MKVSESKENLLFVDIIEYLLVKKFIITAAFVDTLKIQLVRCLQFLLILCYFDIVKHCCLKKNERKLPQVIFSLI